MSLIHYDVYGVQLAFRDARRKSSRPCVTYTHRAAATRSSVRFNSGPTEVRVQQEASGRCRPRPRTVSSRGRRLVGSGSDLENDKTRRPEAARRPVVHTERARGRIVPGRTSPGKSPAGTTARPPIPTTWTGSPRVALGPVPSGATGDPRPPATGPLRSAAWTASCRTRERFRCAPATVLVLDARPRFRCVRGRRAPSTLDGRPERRPHCHATADGPADAKRHAPP